MVPSVYKTSVRLSSQYWEIISSSVGEAVSIDAAVKNISHQAVDKESWEPPWEIYTSFDKTDVAPEMNNTVISLMKYYKAKLCASIKRPKARRRRKKKNTIDCGATTWLQGHTFGCMSETDSVSFSLLHWCMCSGLALWVAHTCIVLFASGRDSLAWYISCWLPFGPRNRCNISHLHKATWGCVS